MKEGETRCRLPITARDNRAQWNSFRSTPSLLIPFFFFYFLFFYFSQTILSNARLHCFRGLFSSKIFSFHRPQDCFKQIHAVGYFNLVE